MTEPLEVTWVSTDGQVWEGRDARGRRVLGHGPRPPAPPPPEPAPPLTPPPTQGSLFGGVDVVDERGVGPRPVAWFRPTRVGPFVVARRPVVDWRPSDGFVVTHATTGRLVASAATKRAASALAEALAPLPRVAWRSARRAVGVGQAPPPLRLGVALVGPTARPSGLVHAVAAGGAPLCGAKVATQTILPGTGGLESITCPTCGER